MALTLVLHAHPYPGRSRGCAALVSAVRDLPGVDVRTLYELYPDFDVDVAVELQALRAADRVVWLAPLYWYSVPALLHVWFEKVLMAAIAAAPSHEALQGKECLWAVTTGGGSYRRGGRHDHPFADFVPPIEMTARYCGMSFLEPFVVHDPDSMSDAALMARANELRALLQPDVAPA
jgi:glutathione-regulated potassium-efflux system ancillary protein KefF